MSTTVLILGSSGDFGTLFTQLLSNEGFAIYGFDLKPPNTEMRQKLKGFTISEVIAPCPEITSLAQISDWVISCMPQQPTLAALKLVTPIMKRGSLFVDILSVKTPITEATKDCRTDIEYLSLHPLFASSVGFPDQNVIAVSSLRDGQSTRLLSLVKKWGAKICTQTAEQHDRSMAAIQVTTHVATILFGMALNAMHYEASEYFELSSPPHRTLLAILARIVNGHPSTYWQIQTENPFASTVRKEIMNALDRLEHIVATEDNKAFGLILNETQAMLGSENGKFLQLASQMFSIKPSSKI